jgi:DnaK suppressor protein
MTPLTPGNLDGFRTLLADRRKQLVADIRTKLAEAKGEIVGADETSSVDGGDRAFLELASELDLAMAERDIRELRDLDTAWERLESGRFGVCIDCGNSIAPARLQANPAAARCNPCQTLQESAHREPHNRL